MTRRPFGLWGLSLLVLTVAVLVAGVLGWVTTSALKVEDDQRRAAAQAERGERERLALWRLDGRVFPTLSLEGYRKFEHFTALYAPPADPPGGPQYLSPLVSTELPEWMPLHFQFDPATGWTSPQVLPVGTVNRLANPTNDLDLSNLTDERRTLLDALNRRFPTRATAEALKELDADASDSSAVVVVAVVPQRTYELSFNRDEVAKRDRAVPAPAAADPQSVTPNANGPVGMKGSSQGGGRGGNPPPYLGNSANVMTQQTGQAQQELANPDEQLRRRNFGENVTRDIKGGFGNTQQVVPIENEFVGPPAPVDLKKSKLEQEMNPADRVAPAPAAPAVSMKSQPEMPAGRPGGGGGGGGGGMPPDVRFGSRDKTGDAGPGSRSGVVGPGGGSLAPEKSAEVTNPMPPPGGPAPAQAAAIRGGEIRRADTPTNEKAKKNQSIDETKDAPKPPTEEPTGAAAPDAKASKDANEKAKELLAAEMPSVAAKRIDDALAVKKSAPPAPPVAVNLGPMRPKWLTDTDGQRELVVVRPARLEGKTVYQGVLLDWEKLRTLLREEVADDFPNADLAPSDGPADSPQYQLSALPVRFDSGPAPELPPARWTTLRLGLGLAWLAAAVALVAVWFGGWSLVDLSERRIRFVSAVTHELRTPLTSLRLYLDMLTSGMVTDEVQKQQYLTTLSHESNRLNQLIENVLDFAKLEKRAGTVSKQPVPVADLLDHARETWGERLAADGKEFVVVSTVPAGQLVTADPRVAQQILGNLIDNARKYSPGAEDPRVWLWVKPAGRRVAFEVEDRGPGIPLAERSSIFRPFRRGGTSGATGGAGLGLALAKQWAESLGGRLTYRPCDGGTGACFRLELPAAT